MVPALIHEVNKLCIRMHALCCEATPTQQNFAYPNKTHTHRCVSHEKIWMRWKFKKKHQRHFHEKTENSTEPSLPRRTKQGKRYPNRFINQKYGQESQSHRHRRTRASEVRPLIDIWRGHWLFRWCCHYHFVCLCLLIDGAADAQLLLLMMIALLTANVQQKRGQRYLPRWGNVCWLSWSSSMIDSVPVW